LWIDGQLLIEARHTMAGPTPFTTALDLAAGEHTLRFEWFNGDGPATARLSWLDVATAILGPAEALQPSDVKWSVDGHYSVAYQTDNNLVIRRQTGEVAWATGTAGAGTPLQVTMQYDGNLVLYADEWHPVWDTGTAGSAGAWLALANDELTLRDPEGTVIWAVPLGVPLLTKSAPAARATVTGSAVTFTWTAVAGESYRVCWDTSNNQVCNATWVDAGGATTLAATGVAPGTYFWQVKTVGGSVAADNGAWRSVTLVAGPTFGKQAPTTGTTGLGSTVTLQWGAVPDEGYAVCWDTSDNGSCDSAWWPNGGATARVLEGLSAGTYYWPFDLMDQRALRATLSESLDFAGGESNGWQVKTAGGGVQADNGAWHHFTVAAEPVATSTAGASGGGTPRLASAEPRVAGGVYAAGVAGAAGLTLLVLVAGPRRRRRVVAAGVMGFVLAPAAALAQTTTQVVEYYTTDALGSVRAVTQRVNGVLQVTRHDFMPFGEEVAPPTASQDKRLFTGKERDSETGMDYFEARYMRASVGRFTTVDPVNIAKARMLDPQKWNRYAYARNNPLARIDPDGLDEYRIFLAPGTDVDRKLVTATAEAGGHTVTFYEGKRFTLENWNKALTANGVRPVFLGHSAVAEGSAETAQRTSISFLDGRSAGADYLFNAPATMEGRYRLAVSASTVAIFACNSLHLASQYPTSDFVGVDSGADGRTSVEAMGTAATAYVSTDARSRPTGARPPGNGPDPAVVAGDGALRAYGNPNGTRPVYDAIDTNRVVGIIRK
jgi:RHS repeat-associated protein